MTRLTDVLPEVKPARERKPKAFLPSGPVVEQEVVPADDYDDGAAVAEVAAMPGTTTPVLEAAVALDAETKHRRGPGLRRLQERQRAFRDLAIEISHELPPPTKAGLAKCLRDVARAPVAIMKRDAYMRLAAWALAAAVEEGENMPASPAPVSKIFINESERGAA